VNAVSGMKREKERARVCLYVVRTDPPQAGQAHLVAAGAEEEDGEGKEGAGGRLFI
jgi:hypothetical protein